MSFVTLGAMEDHMPEATPRPEPRTEDHDDYPDGRENQGRRPPKPEPGGSVPDGEPSAAGLELPDDVMRDVANEGIASRPRP